MEFVVRTRSGGEKQHEENEQGPELLEGILGFSFEEQAPGDDGALRLSLGSMALALALRCVNQGGDEACSQTSPSIAVTMRVNRRFPD